MSIKNNTEPSYLGTCVVFKCKMFSPRCHPATLPTSDGVQAMVPCYNQKKSNLIV